MALAKELPGHTGCINTLYWSKDGDKLLTGSDDTKLNIYLAYKDYKLEHSINTGHTANIFTAKFMPNTSDTIVISGAGDSEIRIFDLNNSDSPLDSMYVCHSDQLKKVCVYDNNPFEFLTCSQDGTVRHFDRRAPHECSKHNIRSFIYAQSRPARQFPLPKGNNIIRGCPPPIVDYSKYNVELNSMSINKLFPHYFAVAGLNDYIYLHDQRMLGPSWSEQPVRSSSSNTDIMGALRCVKRFSHSVDGINRTSRHITACQFSRYNGNELIGSWSSNGIYLFNINDSPEDSSYITSRTLTTNTIPNILNNSTSSSQQNANYIINENYDLPNTNQKKSLWIDIVTQLYYEHNLHKALRASQELQTYLDNNRSDVHIDAVVGNACILIIYAVFYFHRRLTPDSNIHAGITNNDIMDEDSEDQTASNIELFSELIETIGMPKENLKMAERLLELYLEKASYFLKKAIESFQQQSSSHGAESSSSETVFTTASSSARPNTNMYQSDGIYLIMMRSFKADLDSTFTREGIAIPNYGTSSLTADLLTGASRRIWIQLMYITLYSPNDLRQLLNIHQEENDDDDGMDISSSDESDVSMMYARFMDRHIMNLYRRRMMSESSDSYDLDLEELTVFQEIMRQNFETHVGVVKPRMQYKGHCNVETIKDVDFYGLHDEYIVSGSDGGQLFMWDKQTSKIVQILKADDEIVNVAKGHPKLPFLAVSGIDSTVKIFTPTSRPRSTSSKSEPNNPLSYSNSSLMYNLENIVETNNENNEGIEENMYVTRSMIASLSRWGRARRMRRLNHEEGVIGEISEDEDEDEDEYDSSASDSDGITLEQILMEMNEDEDDEL
ncbi:MAG: WD40-repeat-containing domain protein [Benjaminiella poitrasii]|nr:MAG: WD40-repeat-containing domain protein [Benjaminiella poitrasii]